MVFGRPLIPSAASCSRHDEPPLIEQEAQSVKEQLAGMSMLAVHEVAD